LSFETRRDLISKIETLRGSKILTYVTSLRSGVNAQMSDDAVREVIDHLRRLPQSKIPQLDLFLVSNGGDGTVPWRLVPMFREYAERFCVLIPYRAYSAATIMALGADEIVMHRFGAMGPIDPTVTNEFNPIEINTNRRLGISVEDVKAYVSFVKETVGIRHEEELAQSVKALTDKVHPLALGNVERFISQSRMIARKLLELHTDQKELHTLDSIIEALASKLYFHGHPINRVEAKEIGLKILENVPADVESAMWDLYVDYENEMNFRVHHDAIAELWKKVDPNKPGTVNEEHELTGVMVESLPLTSAWSFKTRNSLTVDALGQAAVSAILLAQKWDQKEAQ
jgi:Serine dehydrogenase proteinase